MPDFTPIVSDGYREILGRAPEPGGLSNWNRSMNAGDPSLESRVDYATRHSTRAQDPGPYPILVNEYPAIAPAEVKRQVARAERLGTLFEYWRGDHDEQQWSDTLEALGREGRALVVQPAGAGGRRAARHAGRSARAAKRS